MAISVRGYTTAAQVLSGGSAITYPTGTVAGDLVLIFASTPKAVTITVVTSGWTLLFDAAANGGSDSGRNAVFYRISGGETSVTVSCGNSSNLVSVAGYSGVSPTTPIDVSASSFTLAATSVVTPSVATTTADAVVISCLGHLFSGGPAAVPTGMTSRVLTGAASSPNLSVADVAQPSAGASGTKTWTLSSSRDVGYGTFALRPAVLTPYVPAVML